MIKMVPFLKFSHLIKYNHMIKYTYIQEWVVCSRNSRVRGYSRGKAKGSPRKQVSFTERMTHEWIIVYPIYIKLAQVLFYYHA